MSSSPGTKPISTESRAHMLNMLAGMELPPPTSIGVVGGASSTSAVESLAAAGRTATVEDMFNLAAPEVDALIAKLLPILSPPATTNAAPAPVLPSNPVEIYEVKDDHAAADSGVIDVDAPSSSEPKKKAAAAASKKDVCADEAAAKGLLLATTIGRSKELPIASRIDHPRMSSNHCEIYYHPLTFQIFIRDVSTNGTFLNSSTTRMEKGKLVELSGGEMIQFVNSAAPVNAGASATPLPSTTFLFQRLKALKVVDEEALEEELTCGITKSLLYKPVMALPCLHTFSAHALSQWIDAGNKTCPECRGPMAEVRPSHKVGNLLEQFLKTKGTAITYYTKEEMADFDKASTIPPTGKIIAGGMKRRPNWDEEGYDDYDEDEEDEDDDDDDDDGSYGASGRRRVGMAWVPTGLPFTFGQFTHAGGGFGPSMPLPTCPECNTPAPLDGYQCPAMATHINCHMCKTPFPERPLCGIPQRCALCALPHCDLYFSTMSQPPANGTAPAAAAASAHPTGCKNPNGKGFFKPIKDHTFANLPASLFGGNIVEQSILSMYLSTGGCPSTHFHPAPPVNPSTFDFNLGINNTNSANNAITVAQVWQECLQKFQSGLWAPDVTSITGPLTPNTAVCQPCCGRIFSALLYHYRRAIDKDLLPPAILNRPNCWYGVHCRTQFHNTAHAQNFNHVCPQEKRKE